MADDDINDPDLVAKASRVLLSPECQRINFRWGKQHINAKAYRAVVFAMVDSRIHLYEADAEHTLDNGVEAVYREGSETRNWRAFGYGDLRKRRSPLSPSGFTTSIPHRTAIS